MATLDDGVANLERFIGLVTVATGELERIARDLADSEKDLSTLEDEAAEQGGGLNDRLQDLESALETAEDEAKDAVDDLRDAGGDGQELLGEAQERLEDAVNELEDGAHATVNGIDEAHARLVEEGFLGLARTLDGVQKDLETAREETAGVSAELVAAVEGFESDAQAAWDGVEQALDGASSSVEDLEASLNAAVSQGVEGLDSEASDIEAACSALEGDLTTIYAGLAESGSSEQEGLAEAIQTSVQEATRRVEVGEQERLEQPARAVDEEALATLSTELDQLSAVLAGAAPLAESLPPLTMDLTKCQAIVGRIDELLQAMAG